MNKTKCIATVFLDTNILKFAAAKKHVLRPRKRTVSWGTIVDEVDVYEPHTIRNLDKIRNDAQRQNAALLAMAAYAGITGRLKFYYHREVEYETWGLPGMTNPSGRFFNCPINEVADPNGSYSRILCGGGKGFKERTLEFLSGIRDPRFLELIKATGAYQGKTKPLNLNQALDAFYIWCAECADIEYLMTMDNKLQRLVEGSKLQSSVRIITPHQLLLDTIPKFGLFGGFGFIWRGIRFARTQVGFSAGKGWL